MVGLDGGVIYALAGALIGAPAAGTPTHGRQATSLSGRARYRERAACALLSGVVAGLVGARLAVTIAAPAFWAPAALSVPLALTDFCDRRLPYELGLPIYAVGAPCLTAAAFVFDRWASLAQAAAAMLVVAGLFLMLALAVPGQLGLGDVVLVGGLAMTLGWLGWPQVLIGLAGGLLVAAVAGLLSAARRYSLVRVILPLGPALQPAGSQLYLSSSSSY